MSKNSERVKKWRKTTKQRMIDAFGGKCGICGYCKCNEALEFHHLDPSIKEFSFGSLRANIKGWATIVEELRKCIMVCANCHREIHNGLVTIPVDIQRFDEAFAEYDRVVTKKDKDICPICNINEKPKHYKTCSTKCSNSRTRKVDWKKYDSVLFSLIEQKGSYEAVGEMLGVTGAAISRRAKQLQQRT